ncbi:helix-turn-helix domain-containing protein [Pontibacillus salicampi]|uniref:Helix-turn-helix domain-containing protein n=1 Tax=Pontibacillus salicampi TaxID=1449801 RepID=A0ABV6LP83_9BACI
MHNEQLAAVFKALSHPIRMDILDFLKDGPKTTGDVNDNVQDVSRYAVMKHLTVLEEANLILIRRQGRARLNYINVLPLQQAYERWVSQYQHSTAKSAIALKRFIEGGEENMTEQGLQHDSFQLEQEFEINSTPAKVYTALTEDIGKWWAYRLCGEGSTMTLTPEVGGTFIEKGQHGAAALWGTVYFVKDNEEIRLQGLLGMTGAVNSAYTFKLEPKGNHTVLKLSHHAVGLLDPEWGRMHDEGWKELLGQFLKDYVETGKQPEIN